MRIRKGLFAVLLAALLLCVSSVTAYAHDVPRPVIGSIAITMRCGETAVPGGTLTMYKVGAVYEEDGNYSFVPTGDFSDFDKPLTDVHSSELAKALAEYAKKASGLTLDIDKNGSAFFTGVEPGLYLMVQSKAAAGYYAADPFLVTVPMLEDGTYIYDVDASPKVELEKLPQPTPTPTVPPEKLPQTGQLNWPVPVLVVLGLALFSAGWLLRFGGRKDGYEK